MKNLKNHIDENLSGVKMDYVLSDRILDKTVYSDVKAERKKGSVAKKTVAAFCCVALLTTATAIATHPQTIEEKFEELETNYSSSLVTLNKSVVKNGIELNVISALNDARQSIVYFSLRDLTGNRVNKDLDIKSFSALGGRPGGSGIKPVGFDEETKTAYYVIDSGDSSVLPDEGDLVIEGLFSGFEKTQFFNYDLNLADIINPDPEYKVLNKWDNGDETYLEPGTMNIPIADGVNEGVITNAAVIDGDLHIQIRWEKCTRRDTTLRLLENPDKLQFDIVSDDGNKFVLNDKATGNPVDVKVAYCQLSRPDVDTEYVVPGITDWGEPFDVNKLSDYTLWITINKPTDSMTQRLSVSYPIQKIQLLEIKNPADERMSIEISPISLCLVDETAALEYDAYCDEIFYKKEQENNSHYNLSYQIDKKYTVNIEIAFKNGETIRLNEHDFHTGYGTKSGNITNTLIDHETNIAMFEKEINPNNIKSVTYNGTVLYKK